MNLLLMITISFLVGAGVYLTLSRDLLRVILGLAILGVAANFVVFYAGNPATDLSAIIAQGEQMLPAGAANPLPQVLVLTAIVIGFALISFALVLMVAIVREPSSEKYQANQVGHASPSSRDIDALALNEPTKTEADNPNKPAILESK